MGQQRRKPDDVLVVDADRQFVGYVSPGQARRALEAQHVVLHRKSPPAVQLPLGADPRRFMETTTMNPNAQPPKARTFDQRRTFGTAIPEGAKCVWVQNVGQVQVSFEVEGKNGSPSVAVLVPLMREPIDLAEDADVEALRASQNFRRALNRPKDKLWLKLMTEEEAYDWYARQAPRWKLDTAEEARERGRAILQNKRLKKQSTENAVPLSEGMNFAPSRSAVELMGLAANPAPSQATPTQQVQAAARAGGYSMGNVSLVEETTPRVLELCTQASRRVAEHERMPAQQLLEEFEVMLPVLKAADFAHIESAVVYPTVKQWAREQGAQLEETAETAETAT